MIRTSNVEKALRFYCETLGLKLHQRIEVEKHRFTYIVLADKAEPSNPCLELIHVWDQTAALSEGRNFGHLAFEVENIYDTCDGLTNLGVPLLRAPHDGHKAFVLGPDSVIIELLQKGERLPQQEPWVLMKNPDEHLGN